MAKKQTTPEKLLWDRLKDRALGVRFYKQSPMFGYVADFYCAEALLVVEVDGPFHAKQVAYDRKRDAVLWRKGILTMRFSSDEVENNLSAVVALIANKALRRAGRMKS